jgi:2-dehydropantoate 2-reductase
MGADVSVLARGERAARLESDGLRMRDGITGATATVELDIVRAPVSETFDLAMVCVQALHRPTLLPLLSGLPGRPTIWYLGNTTKGLDEAARQLGEDRVLGGFPGVGGTWEEEVLVYADRQKPDGRRFDRLILGEAHPDAAANARSVRRELQRVGMRVERYVPIMAWHWSHIALILPLAGAVYQHDLDLEGAAADRALLERAMRATAQGFAAVRSAGYAILPRGLNVLRWIPPALGARRISGLLASPFGRIALAAHAAAARDEMHELARDLLALAGPGAGKELREVLGAI